MGAAENFLASPLVRNYVGPAGIIVWSVPFAVLQVYAHMFQGGSLSSLGSAVADGTAWKTILFEMNEHGMSALRMIIFFMGFEICLMLFLPGKAYDGPRTITGHVPRYRDTGLLAYIVTLVCAWVGSEYLHLFDLAQVYDNYMAAIVIMNIFALVFVLLLYIKGRTFPSSTDNHVDGIFVADYYRGIELYPRIGKNFDIKMFTNCRFGMMVWPLLPICYMAKQRELYGEVSNAMALSVALQLIYCFKFFLWEKGYMGTVDIMHDRGGYYICWGCLCFLPSTYTAHTLFLVKHPYSYSTPMAVFIFLMGIVGIFVNYWADYQRQKVRATDGKCTIWGKPPLMIRAKYQEVRDGRTEEKESTLLASGFWGVSRHFHYVPEILAAVCWSAPMPHGYILPYFYVIFLTVLLMDRAARDDRKCAKKYGTYWNEYRRLVPYRVIPGVY